MSNIPGFEKNSLNNIPLGGLPNYEHDEYRGADGTFVQGWKVGHAVGILAPTNQAISEANSNPSSKIKNVQTAVRLVYKKVRGNIWHSMSLKKGHKYTFSWYDLADPYVGDDHKTYFINQDYTVHIDLNKEDPGNGGRGSEPVSDNTSVYGQSYPQRALNVYWDKKTITFQPTVDGVYFISFQGPSHVDTTRDRGAIISALNAEDVDNKDVSKLRITCVPATLKLNNDSDSEHVVTDKDWTFTLYHLTDGQWVADQSETALYFKLDGGDGIQFNPPTTYWKITKDEGESTVMIQAGSIVAHNLTNTTRNLHVYIKGDNEAYQEITNTGFLNNDEFKKESPYIIHIKQDSDGENKWTLTGSLPDTLQKAQDFEFTLSKNGKPAPGETISLTFTPDTYLTAQLLQDKTNGEGKITLHLAPKTGVNGTTTVKLSHKLSGQTYQHDIKTSAQSYRYHFIVEDYLQHPLPDGVIHWKEDKQEQMYVKLVDSTGQVISGIDINMAVSGPGLKDLEAQYKKFKSASPYKLVYVQTTVNGGQGTITLTADDTEPKVININSDNIGQRRLIVTPGEISLAPGAKSTKDVEVTFEPDIDSGSPPIVTFEITGSVGDKLTIRDINNEKRSKGKLQATRQNGTWIIQPEIEVDADANGDANIRFYVEGDTGGYAEATLTVHVVLVDHVDWSTTSEPVELTAGEDTNLNIYVRAYDKQGKQIPNFILELHIDDARDGISAHFIDGNKKVETVHGENGRAKVPEMTTTSNSLGTFYLRAMLPGGNKYLEKALSFKVSAAVKPDKIEIHPATIEPISSGDNQEGWDSNIYAQYTSGGGHIVKSGKITFTLQGSVSFSDTDPNVKTKTVAVNNTTGHAKCPKIYLKGVGKYTFTVIASGNDVHTSPSVTVSVE
ncbi:hypothetical protein BTJ39_19385 [Izhakiella australiensis]|uniref:Uncharacterized protein n=1 Tax=Izhakiella australiensis TaxID=1926881 RepID=A0A1S8YFW1_9GAMM|nr:hypothetical protein [Izhakiella australiensis]OON37981.1 hypothetical protein BTJ39_19385 [Izhakiella australiensis]